MSLAAGIDPRRAAVAGQRFRLRAASAATAGSPLSSTSSRHSPSDVSELSRKCPLSPSTSHFAPLAAAREGAVTRVVARPDNVPRRGGRGSAYRNPVTRSRSRATASQRHCRARSALGWSPRGGGLGAHGGEGLDELHRPPKLDRLVKGRGAQRTQEVRRPLQPVEPVAARAGRLARQPASRLANHSTHG